MFLSQNIETDKLSEDVLTVIEAPRQSDLMIELIKKLKPQVVVTGMAHFEAITSSAFQHLLDTTREIGSRIFLDISDHFELSSLPPSNGVLKYLSVSCKLAKAVGLVVILVVINYWNVHHIVLSLLSILESVFVFLHVVSEFTR